VGGDGDCQGQTEKVRKAAPDTQDMTCGRVKNAKDEVDEDKKRRNRTKAGVRAKAGGCSASSSASSDG
jgi:hypothetical protein